MARPCSQLRSITPLYVRHYGSAKPVGGPSPAPRPGRPLSMRSTGDEGPCASRSEPPALDTGGHPQLTTGQLALVPTSMWALMKGIWQASQGSRIIFDPDGRQRSPSYGPRYRSSGSDFAAPRGARSSHVWTRSQGGSTVGHSSYCSEQVSRSLPRYRQHRAAIFLNSRMHTICRCHGDGPIIAGLYGYMACYPALIIFSHAALYFRVSLTAGYLSHQGIGVRRLGASPGNVQIGAEEYARVSL